MRLIKMLGLAAVAALVVTAYFAAAASADVICETEGLHAGECPANKIIAEKTPFIGLAAEAKLLDKKNGNTLVTCHSIVLALVGANMGKHVSVLALIDSLTWSGCKGQCTKVTSEHLPFLAEALALSLLLHVTEHGKGAPAATLEECSAFKLKCLYEAKGGTALLDIEKDIVLADNVELKRGTCDLPGVFPEVGFWCAKYLITLEDEKTPIYVAALP